MPRIVRARAPLRLSFAGGGTDVAPFPEREGGLVLNATIDRFAYGALTEREDERITIESLDLGLAVEFSHRDEVKLDGQLDLVKVAIQRLGGRRRGGGSVPGRRRADQDDKGFDLILETSAPPGSGLGSSSALVVCLIGMLNRFYGRGLDSYQIAEVASAIEREELGLLGGLQDQYTSSFGGFNFMEFEATRTIVNPLRVREAIIDELESNLLLCFTGSTRAGDRIIEDQTRRYQAEEEQTLTGLRAQKRLAVEMKDALLRGELVRFGELLHEAWLAKRGLSPRIHNSFIDGAYEAAREAGAIGGKVTGAGGGGYMIFYCRYDRKHHVAEALREAGAEITDFAFEHRGLRTWSPGEA
jgi:D-glycero-alpha-D-manno-heptose-7-phosphate kinase